jgi:hypothetical protein
MIGNHRYDSSPVPSRPGERAGKAHKGRCVLAAALVLGALAFAPRVGPVHAAHAGADASALVRYTDAAGGYAFRYPNSWKLSHPRGVDVEVQAPDGNVAAVAATRPAAATATAIDVHVTLGRYVQQFGSPVGAARYGQYTTSNGGTIRWGSMAFRASGGTTGLAMVAGTAYGGHTYALYGVIGDTHAASWQRDSSQLGTIMGSLVVLGRPVQGNGGPRDPGAAATCPGLKQQMTNFSQLAGLYHGMGDSEYMDDQLALADYYYQKANWYNRVVQQDYQEAVRLHCFG